MGWTWGDWWSIISLVLVDILAITWLTLGCTYWPTHQLMLRPIADISVVCWPSVTYTMPIVGWWCQSTLSTADPSYSKHDPVNVAVLFYEPGHTCNKWMNENFIYYMVKISLQYNNNNKKRNKSHVEFSIYWFTYLTCASPMKRTSY